MLEKKRMAVLLAAAMLMTACGGGGGDDMIGSSGGDGTTAPSTNTGGDSSAPVDTVTQPPATSTPSEQPSAPADQQLAGHLELVANQLVYVKTERPDVYWATSLDQFESDEGMYDVASGSRDGDAGAAMPASAVAPAAPMAALGFRVDNFVQRASPEQAVGDQTVVGRVAFSLTERADSPALPAGEVAESMRFVIDRVELATGSDGRLVSARVLEGAQLYIEGRNAAGVDVRETIAVPANAVRLQPMAQVLDALGDDSSVVLMLDLEHAFSQAGAKLAALENIAGHFALQVTLSPAQMIRPAAAATDETPALAHRELIGQAITVGGQAPVTGAGISGNVWIRANP